MFAVLAVAVSALWVIVSVPWNVCQYCGMCVGAVNVVSLQHQTYNYGLGKLEQ